MNRVTTIHYDPAKLHAQYPVIAESRRNALQKAINNAYLRTTGLSADDPHELWRFAIAQIEPLTDLEPYLQFRATLKGLTLRESVMSVTERIKDDAVLARHLATLLKIFGRGPLSKGDYDFNRADEDKRTRFLIEHWIQEPPRENLLVGSLCFCSDLAIAKLAYFKANGKAKRLPPKLLTKEPERIRKLYCRLGLVPAHPRVIKDIEFIGGKVRLIPFKQATRMPR